MGVGLKNSLLAVLALMAFVASLWLIFSARYSKVDYQNGRKYSYKVDVFGRVQGLATEYYRDGVTILSEGKYRNNQLHGDFIEYYESGSILRQSTYEDGLLTGNVVTFWESGDTLKISNTNTGSILVFNKEHQIIEKGELRDGEFQGLQRVYEGSRFLGEKHYYKNSLLFELEVGGGYTVFFDFRQYVSVALPGRSNFQYRVDENRIVAQSNVKDDLDLSVNIRFLKGDVTDSILELNRDNYLAIETDKKLENVDFKICKLRDDTVVKHVFGHVHGKTIFLDASCNQPSPIGEDLVNDVVQSFSFFNAKRSEYKSLVSDP